MEFQGRGSSRHQKIVGDFGEHLILYWLSKHGYECAHIDHVGIDLIAVHPDSGERLGISVKSRNIQRPQSIGTTINIMRNTKNEFDKIYSTCKAFACEPCFAIVVDEDTKNHEKKIYGFMTSVEHFLAIHPPNTKILSWKMNDNALESYRRDAKVKMFVCDSQNGQWL